MYSLEYVSPGGVSFDLFDRGRVRVEADTIGGLVGQFEDTGVQVVGESGHSVFFGDRVVAPLEGSFTVVVRDPSAWREFYRAWSTRVQGSLILGFGGHRLLLRCRLAVPLPFPASVPRRGARVEVSVIGDSGVWVESFTGTGLVTVTNFGDIPVWPEIVWSGSGGSVVLPSGAGFMLPAVDGESVLPLRRSNSGRVWQGGELTGVRVDCFCESVPVGESRDFRVPAGARLSWDVGVLNPWS